MLAILTVFVCWLGFDQEYSGQLTLDSRLVHARVSVAIASPAVQYMWSMKDLTLALMMAGLSDCPFLHSNSMLESQSAKLLHM